MASKCIKSITSVNTTIAYFTGFWLACFVYEPAPVGHEVQSHEGQHFCKENSSCFTTVVAAVFVFESLLSGLRVCNTMEIIIPGMTVLEN